MTQRTVNAIVVPILSALILYAGIVAFRQHRSKRMIELDSGRFMIMGTLARIRVRCREPQRADGQAALSQARETLRRLDRQLSTYRDDSELTLVNRHAAEVPVSVSDETYGLLNASQHFSEMTDGAFDITVAPLIRVWKQAAQANRLPTEDELAEAKRKVGFRNVQLSVSADNHQVRLLKNGAELNVNAIAKGYAVDQALSALRRADVQAGLVDVGGEIACFGGDWIIGIQDPFAADTDDPLSQRPRWRLRLGREDGAVATSGNYRRYVEIAGRRYSHILDPRTAWPVDAVPSVTIIAADAMTADALATAVSVMGVEKGLAMIETQPNAEALLITGTPGRAELHRSSGFAQYELPP